MQHHNENIYKIYSRRRFRLGFLNNNPRGDRFKRKIKKITPYIATLMIAFITCYMIWNAMNPIFETLCEDEAKAIATIITNEETTKVINQYNYDTFFTIEKDEEGNIQMINANVLKINQITSDVALNIQKALKENETNKVKISLGSATGLRMLSGSGPKIPVTISSTGNVDTDLRSEFIAQGVNQTKHRVYLEIQTNVNILTPFSTVQRSINNQVLIAENVILGEIPSTYYNFEGMENQSQALEIVE